MHSAESHTALATNHGQSPRGCSPELSPPLVLVNSERNDGANSEIKVREKSFELRKLSEFPLLKIPICN